MTLIDTIREVVLELEHDRLMRAVVKAEIALWQFREKNGMARAIQLENLTMVDWRDEDLHCPLP